MDIAVGHLEALLALEEHGSFTRAGQALGLTQSAVSRAIAALEHRLGAAVVHRGPSGATLTSVGHEVAAHARAVLEHLRAIEALRGRQPRLRVGAVASALVRFVPEAAARLGPDRPALVVQGEDDELAAWLADETIDLAVTTTPCAGGEEETAITDEFLAVLPRRHPLARRDRVGLADLVAAGVADPGGTCGPLLAAGYAAHGVEWRPAHVVRDVPTVLAMAEAEITAGVVPAIAAPRPAPPGVVLLPLDPPLHRTVYLRHRPGDRQAALLARRLTA
ncbi:LysR family transcriptional regulator [Nonomuraea sp. NPDC046802]|uniref:LysR family transcriptional regulator n=1 Tax=Nonomuraea sp. NPDC046802 TaxID=3154919 RepID=UPI0033DB5D80